jgi:branched-chain amino acid transport system substrate-binding protein
MSATDHMGLDLSAFRMLEIKNGDWTLISPGRLASANRE